MSQKLPIIFPDFRQDEFLHQKLREFRQNLANPQKEESNVFEWLLVLVAGCQINEIEKRIVLARELEEKWPKCFTNFHRLQRENNAKKLQEIRKFGMSEMKELDNDLHRFLR
jgi:hypothetical protein